MVLNKIKEVFIVFWKVNYEKDGKQDNMYFGGATTKEEKNRRIRQLKDNGFNILSCYQVKNMR